MKVNLNNNVYIVKWKHPEITTFNGNVRSTECTIRNESLTFVTETAICSVKEQFQKDKGRKISMARALNKLHLQKPERKIFWEEYLNR